MSKGRVRLAMPFFVTWSCGVLLFATQIGTAQTTRAGEPETYGDVPRTVLGKPNLNGIWQALSSAHWNVVGHAAGPAPVIEMGALGAVPAGLSVVDGGQLPYQNWARAQQQTHYKDRMTLDPAIKCYLPGIPRANYMPFPFQIIQTTDHIMMAYEFADASRVVVMNQPDLEAPVNTWLGPALGRGEDDTLVIDVTDQVAETWFDRAGNFHSDALKVVERYTPRGANHLDYEATIDDPNVFTRPWTLRMPLYRRMDQHMQLLEFKCIEFVEELMYGHLSKKTGHGKELQEREPLEKQPPENQSQGQKE